jgi:chromosomal replication initiator protein
VFPQKQHATTSTDQDRWQRIKERVRFELGEDVFSNWFGRVEFESVDRGVVCLSVPTRFLRKWIESHYADRVLAHWRVEEPTIARLEVSVRSAAIRPALKLKLAEPPPELPRVPREMTAQSGEPRTNLPFVSMNAALGGSSLDPRLTFEAFIVGRSNTLAHAAAKQIATSGRGEQSMFNPLYIHAGVGLGKTHLLQAISCAAKNGDRKVLYLTAERIMSGFVSALRSQSTLGFKEALRANDVLVIDDLQFLQGRSTQHEFCQTTINMLIDAGRQVVIASDRPPSDLENLDDRVRSRLAGGLVVEIGSLGEELRLEILKSRVAAARLHHPRFEVPTPVLVFIAKSVTHNGRDLEGAVNRLLAHDISGQPVTLETAEREMRDLIRPAEPKRVRIEDIQRVVARQYNVSRADILSSRRTANVVRPRQVAMYLAKILTLRSFPEIGRHFGGRDHTTVLYAVRKIDALTTNDAALAEEIEVLKRQLQD